MAATCMPLTGDLTLSFLKLIGSLFALGKWLLTGTGELSGACQQPVVIRFDVDVVQCTPVFSGHTATLAFGNKL